MKEPQLTFSLIQGKTIHLAVCGSVAVYKTLDLMRSWQDMGASVSVTLSQAAEKFITPLTFTALGAIKVYGDMFADTPADIMGHLEPGQQADAFVIAPASANTLGKTACGIADDMLSTQALAFPHPIIFAPAMNPRMWNNPATQDNIAVLLKRNHIIVAPESGRMACGDTGDGRLADAREIHCALLKNLATQDMKGQRVLITAGPTQEPWDGVRYWTNPSSGLMGACMAMAAYLRGAQVTVVAGPALPWLPKAIDVIQICTAQEMFQASIELWPNMDTGIFTAAVADFSPEPHGPEKFKKENASQLNITFKANPDILASAGKEKKSHQKLIGFAAETKNLEEAVHNKLKRKNCDMLIGNFINKEGTGFRSATNSVFVADKSGRQEHWPELPKSEVAWRALNWLSAL